MLFMQLPMLADTTLQLPIPPLLEIEVVTRLLRCRELTVASCGKSGYAWCEIGQSAFDRIDLRVVVLKLEERSYVRMHEPSLISPVTSGTPSTAPRPAPAVPPASLPSPASVDPCPLTAGQARTRGRSREVFPRLGEPRGAPPLLATGSPGPRGRPFRRAAVAALPAKSGPTRLPAPPRSHHHR